MAPFSVGDLVVNFSNVGRVLAVDPLRGLLLKALPGQGFGRRSDRWYAAPEKCVQVPAGLERESAAAILASLREEQARREREGRYDLTRGRETFLREDGARIRAALGLEALRRLR